MSGPPGEPTAADEFARVQAELRTRWPESRLQPSVDRILALVDVLGRPQEAYPVVHVTGTNGKTSTVRMIGSLLHEFGLRVGRFTSPHLSSVTERIALDGRPVSTDRFVQLYDEVAPYLELVDKEQPHPLSYFEVLTAMAFVAFADAPVDVAVVEVGMGGTWDSTNVAAGRVAVVTPIAIDHANYLGATVAAIAAEKAGIIKPGAAAVLAGQQPAAAAELLRRAAEVGAEVAREGAEFAVVRRLVAVGGQQLVLRGLGGAYDEIFLPVHGAHQAQNAACALAAVEAFFGAGAVGSLDLATVRAGFAAATSPGRLETVRTAPTVLLDAAHNPHGMAATVAALRESYDFRRLVGVVSMLSDKDVAGMLGILEPVLDEIVVTANSSPRALPPDELAASAVEVFGGDRVLVEPRLDDALEQAVQLAEADGETLSGAGVLVTGSVVTVGEARTLLSGSPP
jgi:dihydrofolate synthase/folylpolyglutamate synthase